MIFYELARLVKLVKSSDLVFPGHTWTRHSQSIWTHGQMRELVEEVLPKDCLCQQFLLLDCI